ncbi:MAG: nucleoside kinase [bacterium]|nr:nucleoside kinase [bacterium]MDO5462807.1 nucleoside kinase [bacterium]
MTDVIHLDVVGDGLVEAPKGARLAAYVPTEIDGLPVLAALMNYDVVPLDAPLLLDAKVKPLTLADEEGWRVYRRTLCFLLAKVLYEKFPERHGRIRQSFGHNALFWTWDVSPAEGEQAVASLRAELAKLIAADEAIHHQIQSYDQILTHFTETQQMDKVNLLAHRNPPYLALAACGGFYDLPQGILATRTGVLSLFDIVPLRDGFVLEFPGFKTPHELDPMPPFDFLFDIYSEHLRWGNIIGIRNAGELNASIADGTVVDVINTVEALHEKRLASFADKIAARVPRPHIVLVAGPSSAGKTTFSMRLCTHLRVLGLRPTLISTDNYFVGDERNPRDEQGNLDYEHLDAVDRPRLNQDVLALLRGETIPMRRFDFFKHEGYDSDKTLSLDLSSGILVIEGIHSLNPNLMPDIPREEKFLIYVNALTQLAIDGNNRISTIDNRLLRRIVRDGQFRGRSPRETLRLWPAVRAGEERWILPFQHCADAVFNTSLDYEIPVLKTLAAPLLNQIKPSYPEFTQARRLSCFLQNFASLPMADVPTNSILREYLGASRLRYES